ncbi:MAG: DUF5067 domain-containing protein [Parabacteroides sp.]|nr:DUF5067 domain-containing protein [Parabacteroides sp.]
MKKCTLAFILAFVLALSLLTACGNSSSKNDLTNNPSIESVKEAISDIESITLIEIVTEDNDPNEQLGKQGGYTGSLFFKSSLVTDETDESAITAGTDGGGSIEVYANKSDAEKRNEYLATFDGTAVSSGSHKVLGTLVIRTSNRLKASQQTKLETEIINALTGGGNSTPSEAVQTETQASLLDKEETMGRISYHISSAWNKTGNADTWRYLPYESEDDGFFQISILPLDTSPIVDTDILNENLDLLAGDWKSDGSGFNPLARTDINGIPVQQFEIKPDDSGNIFTSGFYFIYGDSAYMLSAISPETSDSQFFTINLKQIMDSLVIKEYTQSELASSGEGDIGDYHVKILDASFTKDYNGTPAIVVNFEFTNNSEDAEMFLSSTNVTAYQDGVELDIAMIMNASVYDAGLAQKKIKPGVSLVVQSAFVLASDSPVEIEVAKFISFGNDPILTKTFNLQ